MRAMNGIVDNHVDVDAGPSQQIMALPLHLQSLESALDVRPFMQYARDMLSRPLTSPEETEVDDESPGEASEDEEDLPAEGTTKKKKSRKLGTKQERQAVKAQLYNFSDLTADREWLYDAIMSDTDSETDISDEDDYIRNMLRTHMKHQKIRENYYKKQTNTQYAYYGAGLLSNHDMFIEHQQSIVGVRKRKRRTKKEKPLKLPPLPKPPKLPKVRKPRQKKEKSGKESKETDKVKEDKQQAESSVGQNEDDDDIDVQSDGDTSLALDGRDPSLSISRGRRRRSQSGIPKTPEALAARRRRVWQLMAKKEIPRVQRAYSNNHKEMIQNAKRAATMCMKAVRQKALQSQKVMKETVWRAKRLTREMLAYWKRYERVERDTRRRMEKEAEEQRKQDVELIEAKRQQRKLNFLITQTELYAHFMSKKLGQGTEAEQLRILNQLDEEVNPRLAAYDDYDADQMKLMAQKHAEQAVANDINKTKQFDVVKKEAAVTHSDYIKEEDKPDSLLPAKTQADLPQPKMFKGTLKAYQIKGMTWLANIYDQGISGILADEMGLGKTVQSIAFLCHIAEHYGVWGPFLVISPASTLHNWQQEMQRFVPDFNVVPYWGSPNERKILRQFWEQKDLHTRDASFHVVITSYQLIVSDYKYFNRIKWQYMILDEAQAIKSATSMRWKLLLGFNCRNRLLLSGTPIQNSMAELWALLHFIMPTLFDSHDEFNEWFSKDIESHAENKTGIDEKQISRLHMILKPFMLRRIKKDVENELSDKIEIMVYCPLTIRQKLLYMALKQKIRIEDLLNLTRGGGGSTGDGSHHIDRNFTSNLMNLVMQFRKVCNHPELFERRDAKSPFAMKCEEYVVPRLVFHEAMLFREIPSKRHLLFNRFSIFKSDYLYYSLFYELNYKTKGSGENYTRYVDLYADTQSCYSFTRLSDLSPKDLEDITINGLITLFQHYRKKQALNQLLAYRREWWSADYNPVRFQLLEPTVERTLNKMYLMEKSILRQLLFTRQSSLESSVYAFGDFKTCNMQETIEHRVIRSKYKQNIEEAEIKNEMLDEAESELIMNTTGGSSANTKKLSKEPLRLLPEFEHKQRMPQFYQCEPLEMPRFLYGLNQKVNTYKRRLYCESRAAAWSQIRHEHCENSEGLAIVENSLEAASPRFGWSSIVIPDKETLISDAGKLAVLDSLLTRLKAEGHRVLIYSQMTKMIDLLEEYMWHRKHRYMRLDGSSKISARRDMVADFQSRQDIFVFLLSTRAGGLGINLTAADTLLYAFSASAVGIMFGFYGLAGGEEMPCSVVKQIMAAVIDFIPLSLMNIEILLALGKPYALVHAPFFIPLLLDIIAKLFGDDGDDEVTQILKNINNLADVISLATVSYTNENYMYEGVATSFLIAQNIRLMGNKECVIFYDSDWNPTVDQQAMDRAHRLGQTKQVTVYRLICKGTIEERILQRAREKSEIQRMVISGGNFKPDTLKPKEVVSLLLDDEEIETKYRQKAEGQPDSSSLATGSRDKDYSGPSTSTAMGGEKRKRQQTKVSSTSASVSFGGITIPATPSSSALGTSNDELWHTSPTAKRIKLETLAGGATLDDDSIDVAASETSSTSLLAGTSASETYVPGATSILNNDDSDNEALVVDCESPRAHNSDSPTLFDDFGGLGPIRRRHHPRGTKRGRPRGSTRRGGGNGTTPRPASSPGQIITADSVNEDVSSSVSEQPLTNTGEGVFSPTAVPTPVKRGPGRPRIKTGGPVNQGTRGAPRTRKPIGPLVVPLPGSSPAATPLNRSPAISPLPSPVHSEKASTSSGGGASYYQPGYESMD